MRRCTVSQLPAARRIALDGVYILGQKNNNEMSTGYDRDMAYRENE